MTSVVCRVNLRAYVFLDSDVESESDLKSSSCWSLNREKSLYNVIDKSKRGQRSFTTGKTQCFEFDGTGDSPFSVFSTASSLLRTGFNVSLWLDKAKFKPNYSQMNHVKTELMLDLVSKLSNETYLMGVDDGIRVSWSISLNCFEVLGDYVKDLLATSSSSSTSSTMPEESLYDVSPVDVVYWGLTPLRLKESENGVHLSGLESLKYTHSDSVDSLDAMIARLDLAINHRARLMQSSPGYKFDSIGDVGHCIMEVHLEQLIFTKDAEYIKRNSVCKLVSFADLDSLTYKPSSANANLILMDSLQMKKIDALLKRVVSQTEPDLRAATALQNIAKLDKVELCRTVTSSSIRSLSTLTRIAKLLDSPRQQHIPYRDSILTRIFQPLLEGNFCPLLITTASGDLQNKSSTIHALRFASQLRCICNHVLRNDCILPLSAPESENVIKTVFERTSHLNLEGITCFDMIMDADMMIQRLYMYEENQLMTLADIDAPIVVHDDKKSLAATTNAGGGNKRQNAMKRYMDIQSCMEGGLEEVSRLLQSAMYFSSLGLTLEEDIYMSGDAKIDNHTKMDMHPEQKSHRQWI